MRSFLLFFVLACAVGLPLQTQTLVKDIEQAPAPPLPVLPSILTSNGGELFFWSNGPELRRTNDGPTRIETVIGYDVQALEGLSDAVLIGAREDPLNSALPMQLFRTGGTAASTWPLEGTECSEVRELVRVGNEVVASLYFSDLPNRRTEIWVTDGSLTGTRRIGTFSGGVLGSLHGLSGRVFFASASAVAGAADLWVAEDSSSPFQNIGVVGMPRNFTSGDGFVVFSGVNPALGYELWISDGTAAGTRAFDLNPGGASSSPGSFLAWDEVVYFVANFSTSRAEVWRADGTLAGTRKVSDVVATSAFSVLHPSGVIGTEAILSVRDGTVDQMVAVAEGVAPRVFASGVRASRRMEPLGKGLVFGGFTSGPIDPWFTDGTATGTYQIASLASAEGFTEAGGLVYFTALADLWATDGTAAGTARLTSPITGRTFGSVPTLLGKLGDRAFLLATEAATGRELWTTDGSEAGTNLFWELTPGPASGSLRAFHFTDTFFTFESAAAGRHDVWASDGSASGTRKLLSGRGSIEAVTTSTGSVLMVSGSELWLTDGTPVGTRLVYSHSVPSFGIVGLRETNGSYLFVAQTASGSLGIWSFDLASATAQQLWAPALPTTRLAVRSLAPLDGSAYFFVDAGTAMDVWKTDGASASQVLSIPIAVTGLGATAGWVTPDEETLFFFTETAPGTVPLFGYDPDRGLRQLATQTDYPLLFTEANDERIVFSEDGTELWASDGFPSGTSLIRILGGGPNFAIRGLAKGGATTTLFALQDGREWVTDGTGAGTRQLSSGPATQVWPCSEGGLRLGSSFLYCASELTSGAELYTRPLSSLGDYAAEEYGARCGTAPTISYEGEPRASSPLGFSVVLEEAPANSLAWLFFSSERANFSFGSCFVGLAGSLSVINATTDAAGRAQVSFPPSLSYIDQKVDFQFAVLDPAGPLNGVSLSSALEIVGGP